MIIAGVAVPLASRSAASTRCRASGAATAPWTASAGTARCKPGASPGEAVFVGDTVLVTLVDGKVAAFAVDGLQRVAKDAFPTASVYGKAGYPSLRLITCGGPFDQATGHYTDTTHPVIRSFEPGESWRWCFVDEVIG